MLVHKLIILLKKIQNNLEQLRLTCLTFIDLLSFFLSIHLSFANSHGMI